MRFIVFDSNIWVSQFGLQSKNGAAVRLFVKQHQATVAIPEVVEVEVEHRLTEQLMRSRRELEKGHATLLRALGSIKSIDLPPWEAIREAVRGRMLDLDVPTRRVPLNVEVARSSMNKLVLRKPPAGKKGGFRDAIIWAHCLDLLAEGDVYLVSNDKDFYEGREHARGLAQELIEEMEERSPNTQVKLFPDLAQLLEDIRVPIDLSVSDVMKAVSHIERERIGELLIAHGFGRTNNVSGSTRCFATEKATEIYFTFDVDQECLDVIGGGRSAATLGMTGFGFLDSDTKEVNEVQLSRIRLTYPEWNPGGPSTGTVFASGTAGGPLVYRIRAPLSND